MTEIGESRNRERRDIGPRRRSPFSVGDLATLIIGAVLVISMLSWFSWRLTQNMVSDRAVAEGRSPSPVPSH